jgi:hypothetical protein
MITNVRLHLSVAAPAAQGLWAIAAHTCRALWNGLRALGANRARSELLRVARVHDSTDPQLAAQLRQLAREDWLTQS